MPFMTDVEEAMETAQEIMHNDIGDVLDPEHEQDQDDLDLEGVEETDNFIKMNEDAATVTAIDNFYIRLISVIYFRSFMLPSSDSNHSSNIKYK